MIKKVASWSKSDIPDLIGRKKVDWSIFEHGSTTIPIEFHEDFNKANNGTVINRGKRREVSLLVQDKEYKANLRNADRKVESDTLQFIFGKELRNYLREIFHTSLEYLNLHGKTNIPKDIAEYIEFYETGEPFKYKLNLITSTKKVVGENKKTDNISDFELVNHIFDYIKSKGFYYERDEVMNLFLALKTKPFVILSGISGTGKTMMVKWFAESLNATNDNGQFTLIPVRPDWSDGSDILGYKDIKGDFIQGPLTKVLQRAAKDLKNPYFVVLDEMNLARVEYYFSDFLSVIESREWVNGVFSTHSVLPEETLGEKLGIPENVYIIGTVNMDETTFPFSKKVLDRANTIEFNRVVLNNYTFLEEEEIHKPLKIMNSNIMGPFLHLRDAYEKNKSIIQQVAGELVKINSVLESVGAHIGYRVRDEICFYIIYNRDGNLMDFNVAFDYQLMQKILPRLSGSDYRIYSVLKDLFTYCTNYKVNDDQLDALDKSMKESRFPKSAKKLADMIRRYHNDGFTSFWLGS